MDKHYLTPLFAPASIAVLAGRADNPESLTSYAQALHPALRAQRFAGSLQFVDTHTSGTLADLAQRKSDLAIIALPADEVAAALEIAGRIKCRAALLISSGMAVAQAQQLAANLMAHLQGRATRPFAYRSKGMMATTGHHKGVAEVFGLHLSGLPAWLLWRAYYLSRMPTFGRKLRIWVEWTWSLFFPADITHLRFTRTHEVDSTQR